MICNKCKKPITSKDEVCKNCNTDVVKEKKHESLEENASNTKNGIIDILKKYKKFIIIGLAILGVIIAIIIGIMLLSKEDRTETLTNIEKKDRVKFVIDGKEYYLGQEIKNLIKEGLSYNDNYVNENDYILRDSITVYPFYYNEKAQFLGVLYCSSEDRCKYDDAVLIKANFYSDSDVIVDDFIKIGMPYDEIREEYGKEEGEFYQDEAFLVWTFGEEGQIGEPYYLLKFNSSKKVSEIRIGVWWYEEEFEYTVD